MSRTRSIKYGYSALSLGLLVGLAPSSVYAVDLSVDSIEITQSIQDSSNSVHTVDGRTTTVRVTVDTDVTTSNVQGLLRVYSSGGTLLLEALSDNGAITAETAPDRELEDDTLNFTFLPESAFLISLFGRTLTFEVTVDPFDSVSESDESNNVASETKYFNCRRAPLVIGLPIDYTAASETDASTLGEPDPNYIAQGSGDAFTWGAYPFPDYEIGENGKYRIMDAPALAWGLNIDTSYSAMLTALETQRLAASPVPDYLYGWMRENPFLWNGVAVGAPGTVAFGNSEDNRGRRTFAHELGHLFGFGHTTNTISEVGWDTQDALALGYVKESSLYDIMAAGLLTDEAWIEAATVETVYADITNACAVLLPLEELIFFDFQVLVPQALSQPWRIRPIFELESLRYPIDPIITGPVLVRMLDATNTVLYTTRLSPVNTLADGSNTAIDVLATTALPALASATKIQVVKDGVIKATRIRSANAPSVDITSLQNGATLNANSVITWTQSDLDGDTLQSVVRYSPDGGDSFVPLKVRFGGTSFQLLPQKLAATTNGIIEVRVTDGFNTTTKRVKDLILAGNKAPKVALKAPYDGQVFSDGANVVFLGSARDVEDGAIAEADMDWSSSIDGALGTGSALNNSTLSPGTHTITFEASDSNSAVTSKSVSIVIQ